MRNRHWPFRGVSNKYLSQYVALYEWGYHVKRATAVFLGTLSGTDSDIHCHT